MSLLLLLLACTGKDDTDTAEAGPTVVAPPLVVNEFLTRNVTDEADPAGEFDDWIEIYNDSDAIVQFEGLYLTDDFETPTKWELPVGQGIDAHGYVVIWCDKDDGSDGVTASQGARHANFQLNGKGEEIGIYYIEDGNDGAWADQVEFESQADDLSFAHVPDASLNWVSGEPTPGDSNGD